MIYVVVLFCTCVHCGGGGYLMDLFFKTTKRIQSRIQKVKTKGSKGEKAKLSSVKHLASVS